MKIDFEIIFSENGSTDKTLSLINDFVLKRPECKVISNKIANYGTALKNGFMEAKNEMIISFDIDYFSETFLHDSLSLEKKYSVITASKRLNESEDGRKLIRRIATNFFVLILKFFFQTSMSDTHGMKGVRKSSCEKHLEKVVSTQDLFDTELLLRIERSGEKIYEVPAMVNEIRPSVSVIYSRIPRTIYSLIKLEKIVQKLMFVFSCELCNVTNFSLYIQFFAVWRFFVVNQTNCSIFLNLGHN